AGLVEPVQPLMQFRRERLVGIESVVEVKFSLAQALEGVTAEGLNAPEVLILRPVEPRVLRVASVVVAMATGNGLVALAPGFNRLDRRLVSEMACRLVVIDQDNHDVDRCSRWKVIEPERPMAAEVAGQPVPTVELPATDPPGQGGKGNQGAEELTGSFTRP